MKPKSQTKTIQSTPISTIKEELRAAYKKLPIGKWFERIWNDTSTLCCDHSSRHMDHTDIGELTDLPSATMLLLVQKHFPALLESHDMLEAEKAEREWKFPIQGNVPPFTKWSVLPSGNEAEASSHCEIVWEGEIYYGYLGTLGGGMYWIINSGKDFISTLAETAWRYSEDVSEFKFPEVPADV